MMEMEVDYYRDGVEPETPLETELLQLAMNLHETKHNKLPGVISETIYVLADLLEDNLSGSFEVEDSICRMGSLYLTNYRDKGFRDLIDGLARKLPAGMIKHMSNKLFAMSTKIRNKRDDFPEKRRNSEYAEYAMERLRMTAIFIPVVHFKQHRYNGFSADLCTIQLIQAQSVFLTAILSTDIDRYSEEALAVLLKSWRYIGDTLEEYASAIVSRQPSLYDCVMSTYLSIYPIQHESRKPYEYRGLFLRMFIQVVINTKERIPGPIIRFCRSILKLCEHAVIKKMVLPELQRAMLRDPEMMAECVGMIVNVLQMDFEPYTVDLGKSFISMLRSEDEMNRYGSAMALKPLVAECRDSNSIEQLLQHIFDVYNGSEGELTDFEHKISLLKAAANLHYFFYLSRSETVKLAEMAAENFLKILHTEADAIMVCHVLNNMSLWCKHFSKVPPSIMAALLRGLAFRSCTTRSVRTEYLKCMWQCFGRGNISQAKPFFPVLLNIVANGYDGTPERRDTVTKEAECAAFLLCEYKRVASEQELAQCEHWLKIASNIWCVKHFQRKYFQYGNSF